MPLYMGIARPGLTLHLSEHPGDAGPHGCVFLEMEDIRAFHGEIAPRKGDRALPELEETFYRTLAMQLVDPFGNRLRFNERLPEA